MKYPQKTSKFFGKIHVNSVDTTYYGFRILSDFYSHP